MPQKENISQWTFLFTQRVDSLFKWMFFLYTDFQCRAAGQGEPVSFDTSLNCTANIERTFLSFFAAGKYVAKIILVHYLQDDV